MKNIIESFLSIQGEGIRTGRPTLFIRLNGCNLRCVFHNNEGKVASICDTNYSSFEGSCSEGNITDEDVIDMLVSHPNIKDVVITGGEPLLNVGKLDEFVEKLRNARPDFALTIETNGTLAPSDYLLEQVDLWSVSPKLKSSVPTIKDAKKYGFTDAQVTFHETGRINLYALTKFVNEGHDCQLKFVYTGRECIEEIKRLAASIQENLDEGLNVDDFIMLMPEGITTKSILGKSEEVVNVCCDNGWTYTTRMHILIWGNVKEK